MDTGIETRAPVPELVGQVVADVLVRHPKTTGSSTTVAEARTAFADDHVHMLLVTDRERLLGTVVRSDLPPARYDEEPARSFAVLDGRTISPCVPAEAARQRLLDEGTRRLAVVDESGALWGLLCLNRSLRRFCSDDDVAARAAERATAGC